MSRDPFEELKSQRFVRGTESTGPPRSSWTSPFTNTGVDPFSGSKSRKKDSGSINYGSHAVSLAQKLVMGGMMGFFIGSLIPVGHALISRVPLRSRKVSILTGGVSMAVIFGFGGLVR